MSIYVVPEFNSSLQVSLSVMVISLQMHSSIGKVGPWLHQTGSKGKGFRVRTVAWAMQEGKSNNMNLYEVLCIRSDVGVDEIKKAYRRMALQCHPDVYLDPTTKQESTRRFMEVRKAYEMLSDPILRNMYDFEMGLVGSVCGEERRLSFNKKVWEDQLQGLARRACRRGKKRKKKDTM